MKTTTIEIPTYLAEQLIATGKELATQNNLATSWPIWYVTEENKIYVGEGMDAEHKERRDLDYIEPSDVCDDCRATMADEDGDIDFEKLPEDCDSWKCEGTFVHYNVERQFTSYGSEFFLTQKACQEYIDSNSYHFTNPKPYAGSAHRNYEMQPIIQALILMAGQEVPKNHYGVIKE